MSTLEFVFWHILGYSAIPIILIVGFGITVGIGCFILEMTGHGGEN